VLTLEEADEVRRRETALPHKLPTDVWYCGHCDIDYPKSRAALEGHVIEQYDASSFAVYWRSLTFVKARRTCSSSAQRPDDSPLGARATAQDETRDFEVNTCPATYTPCFPCRSAVLGHVRLSQVP
jgi:hypothetical protein